MVVNMNELEMKNILIEEYSNLQRIKSAADKDKEIAYQEKKLLAKMQGFGIPTEDLDIK